MSSDTGAGFGWGATELSDYIDEFRTLTAEEIIRRGFTVEGTFDEVDDPVLLGPDGLPVRAWQEGYPYQDRMSRREYDETKRALQVELLQMQSWARDTKRRIVIVFEGRDAAGKGGTIKRFMEHLDPRDAYVVALGVPSERDKGEWFFQRYIRHLPTNGEIAMFDRSWYNRAVVEPVMGFCTDDEYEEFMRSVPEFERMLVDSGIELIKYYLDISRDEQAERLEAREVDPLKRWKISPIDAVALEHFDDYTAARDEMLQRTHDEKVPWTIVRADKKKPARLALIRDLLDRVDAPDIDEDEPDREIVFRFEHEALTDGRLAR